MLDSNKKICFDGQELIDIFIEIDFILISLANIGRNYEMYQDHSFYEKDTTKFIDECQVTERLANIRSSISMKFENSLGCDNMGDLERATENTKYWKCNFE